MPRKKAFRLKYIERDILVDTSRINVKQEKVKQYKTNTNAKNAEIL
jgi:hypothetical protein